ncbi:hypothetical protein DFH09DRAFT_113641 [Mycena vulgaris]|nr:hypothetical protein DFH09DRAFT_113641 [Mycena vulgaris]
MNETTALEIQALPIHERPLIVDPQLASPLYGIIPPEIRNILFEAMLAEYTMPDPYPPALRRPGYTGPRAVSVALLRTCRRIYLETYHLPAAHRTHVFWHAPSTGPHGAQFPDIHGSAPEAAYFGALQPWQLERVKEVQLFTQMFWLDQSFAELACAGFMQGVERLKITIRRGDWWWCEQNYPFFINPHRGGYLEEFLEDVEREGRSEVIPWADGGWGRAFRDMWSLQELEMEFETSVDRKGEMKTIVDRARTWRFPMERGVLSNKGLGVESSQWTSEDSEEFCVFAVKWKLVTN